MNFTFGIVTDGKNDQNIELIINSIERESIPINKYEILIIGDSKINRKNTKVIWRPEESVLPSNPKLVWLSRKRNTIAIESQMDTVVFMNDYVALNQGWYSGWQKYEGELDIASNYFYTKEGPRHSDWVLCPYDIWHIFPEFRNQWNMLLDGKTTGLNRFQYISGNYWVASKEFSLKHPQLEHIGWGDGAAEDVIWCKTFRNYTTFKFNINSSVVSLKPNRWAPSYFPNTHVNFLQNLQIWMDQNDTNK